MDPASKGENSDPTSHREEVLSGSVAAGPELHGILLLLAAMAFNAGSDTFAKYLTASVPAAQIIWMRYLGLTAFVLCTVGYRGPRGLLRSNNIGVQVMRGIASLGSAMFFVTALSFLSVAEVTSIAFFAPLIATALAVPVLGEKVSARRWIAVLVSFLGVLCIIKPGTATFHPAMLLAMGSAVCWGTGLVLTRKIALPDGTTSTLAFTAAIGLCATSMMGPFLWVPLGFDQMLLGMGLATAYTAGQVLTVVAYRRTAASLLAPFSYSLLIWSMGLGFLAFGTIPDVGALFGAAVIVSGGLYTARGGSRP
jgi:drug/metabolite transporter (DMT)-like permease